MPIKTFLIKITTSLLLCNFAWAHDHVPGHTHDDEIKPALELRVFKNINKKHSVVTKIFAHDEHDRNINGLEFSFRRKVSRHVQYGLELDATTGVRHDEDWVKKSSEDWVWKDSSDYEFSSNLFIRLKRQLTFLPGSNWIGEVDLKTRNNWTNSLLTLIPVAKLIYIHFKNGKPAFNAYVKGANYIPLNYSTEDIYKTWYYLGFLYHLNDRYKPFVFYKYQETTWTRSKDFKTVFPEENYMQKSEFHYIGLGLNIYL